ncbi:MAG: NfeD family protein [gamma proteobacterium symbiont of Bathyaustriella thionipta]|nr:NfeD family protein [gamma proteobacterium symbiont of Bathyaustriella thionipta]MCU7948555.1 NfeD family protein [gamma proteobacterium symbiont of Bathyaustriella thionipta]MCU7954486.1 NfeD family protein [gamma proteobacterium symbiont of Bathyaustriella thionipta]MCU7955167.1 NfeD family protein [gamma proteobacterium symbiont of Bathyaustriella thionipta]MCU7966032.1 NfeD family protein [gamma proteobacterium symbiont of Bathyaustriella thionipta]
MESLFTQLEFWHWLTFAVLLIIMEIFSPGAFFLWLGIASACVGVVLYIRPELSWQSQMMIFAVLSVASIVAWRLTRRLFPPVEPSVSHLNRRAEQYVGRTFRLIEPISNGVGKIKVDDSSWRVQGVDTPINTPVKVTGVDGIVLEVEPVLKEQVKQ